MTSPVPLPPSSSSSGRKQKRMGPAPFASFEDLSDEVRARLDSPEDKNLSGSVVRLPGIREDATPTGPAHPTSNIERTVSNLNKDPTNVEKVHPKLENPYPHTDRSPSPLLYRGISLIGAVNTPPSGPMSNNLHSKVNIRPPGTPRIDISRASSSSHHDSRDSSPERELYDSQDVSSAKLGLGFKEDGALDLRSSTEELDFQDANDRRKNKFRPPSPTNLDEISQQRKDSQCSDIVLLSISGRTSRLSSIGSQGSAQSGQSRLSNTSHLSGISRCSSPHKMVLETSFCGTKPPESTKLNQEQPKVESEDMEKVLLARKHDPTEAIIAEGITVEKKPPEKPARKQEVETVKSDVTITINKPNECSNTKKIPSRFISEGGVEYFYIPLKGPLPVDSEAISTVNKPKISEVKSANYQSRTKPSKTLDTKVRAKSATPLSSISKKVEEPKYIRIKLKPDGCYSDESPEIQKPDTLELEGIQNHSNFIHNKPQLTKSSPNSPKLPRDSGIAESNIESVTPSPSISRRSSFASLFKSKEAIISPESPSVPGHKRKNTISGILRDVGDNIRTRSRSRSKSRDRDSHKSSLSTAPSSTESIDSKSKHKSVLSLFKSSKKSKIKSESDNSSQETLPHLEGIGKVEFKFNECKKTYYENPLDAASIRIPLHSPEYYEDRNISQDWKTSSQDSQETVIEAPSNTVEPVIQREESFIKSQNRQSSTSSDNVVFSTKLDNEVFTTKLPKSLPKANTDKSDINKQDTKIKEIVTSALINDKKTSQDSSEEINIGMPREINRETSSDITKDMTKNSGTVMSNDIVKDSSKELSKGISVGTSKENIRENLIKSRSNSSMKENDQKKLEDKRISQISVNSNIEDDRNSSESEKDTEDFLRNKKELDLKLDLDVSEPERKAIVLQQDSFEDELPYVPTTLPLERSAALPIVPVKQRSTYEIKTCSIERPRSTTPINPSCLEEYCEEVMGSFNIESVTKTIEKLKISLPRNDSFDKTTKVKSPRKKDANWQEFAGKTNTKSTSSETPPPLPPKGIQKSWINFEEIPEKRKAPKRIQTIPSRSYIEVPESVLQETVVYNYVNPDECKCECHEINAKEREKRNKESQMVQEDELPLLDDDNAEDDKTGLDTSDRTRLDVAVSDCRSIISDSSVDLSTSIDPHETTGIESSLRTPFTSDLGLSSNRSSILSQDDRHSPDSPNAFPKIS